VGVAFGTAADGVAVATWARSRNGIIGISAQYYSRMRFAGSAGPVEGREDGTPARESAAAEGRGFPPGDEAR